MSKRIASDKVLRDKIFRIAKNPIYDEYQKGLIAMVYNFFDKKPSGSNIFPQLETLTARDKSPVKSEIMPNRELAEELHKPIIKIFEKQKV